MTAGTDPHRPTSTYRLQINADFDLFEAARRLPYLHDLGVDWVYLSPLLAAEPGSTHGYDVVAFDRVDGSRGGKEGLAALSAEARRLGMGVLVDIVPNHVGVATPATNAWWWDVLEHGPESVHAEAFDIDWEFGHGRLLIPVLGDDDLPVDGRPTGHLEVVDDELRYHDNRFPIAPGTAGGSADEVHARQHYELIGWRRGDADLNYRRFFTVTTLAGVRVEVPEVFAATHTEVRRWFDERLVDGLRIDHPDGLRDPRATSSTSPASPAGGYTLIEKILEPGEELPARVGDGRHHRVRRTRDPRPGAHRPGGRAAADRPRCAAAAAGLRTGSSWCTTASARSRTAACWPRPGASCASSPTCCRTATRSSRTPSPRCSPASRSTAPTCPPGVSTSTRRCELARQERPDLADVLDDLGAGAGRPGAAGSAALPAEQRHGDGEGRGGLRVLPVLAAHLAQRGRRRPRHLRDHPRAVPRGDGRPGSATGRTR